MKQRTPVGKHSIAHQTSLLGAGMSMTILDPSTFHGYTDSLQQYVDGVRRLGPEEVDDEPCDVIEVSIMKGQRSWQLWLSRRDRLPRRLKQVVRVTYDIVMEERWRKVTVNAEMTDEKFSWKPPAGWRQWRLPGPEERLLKAGAKAPDFELLSAEGKKIRLSDYRDKVVWLCIWRVGCAPCREEIRHLQKFHDRYAGRGLVILGLNADDSKQIALELLRKDSVTFPNIIDSSEAGQRTCFRDYRSSGVPLSYIIDREGKIVDAWYGYEEGHPRALRALGKLGVAASRPSPAE